MAQFDNIKITNKAGGVKRDFDVRKFKRHDGEAEVQHKVSPGSMIPQAPAGATELKNLTAALWALTAELPTRISLRQALFFVVFASSDVNKADTTLGDIRDMPVSESDPSPLFGHGIERTYTVFLQPTGRDPDNLGWLRQVEDEVDRRRRYLRLTPKGEAVVAKLVKALKP